MWNAESLPRQTHRLGHRRPQWPSRAALYTHKDTQTCSLTYMCRNVYTVWSHRNLMHTEIGHTAPFIHVHELETAMLSAHAEDVIFL